MATRAADAAQDPGDPLRPRSGRATRRAGSTPRRADGAEVPITVLMRKGTPLDGSAPLLLYGYGAYGYPAGADLLDPQPQPGRPRLDLGHRPRPRRLGQGLGLVPGRPQVQEDQHLHRLHRLRRAPGRRGLWRGRADRRLRRLGRRHADGRDRQHAARPLGRDHRRGAVRRRAQHHERHQPAADAAGVARVGQSAGGRGGLRLHRQLQPLRQRRAPSPIRPILATGGLSDPRVTWWEPEKWIARLREHTHQRRARCC